MTLAELENAKAESLKEIAAANDAAAVEALRVKYVGRNGSIPALIKAMKDVPKEERPAFGKAVQAWRAEVEAALTAKGAGSSGEKAVDADLTLPGRWWGLGFLTDLRICRGFTRAKQAETSPSATELPRGLKSLPLEQFLYGRGERSPAAHRRPTPVPDTRKAPPCCCCCCCC